ncbi:MAG: DUF1648 domain-containing protein [Bacteroidota bacterium]
MLRALLWILALGLVGWSVWIWPGLPAEIPLHSDLDGRPTRTGAPTFIGWMVLPLIGIGLAALLDGVGWWAVRNPEKRTLNLPQSDAIMALPVERRVPVLRTAAAMSHGIGAILLLAFACFQVEMYVAAHGGSSQGWTLAGLAVSLLSSLVGVVGGMVAVSAELDRQKQAVA